MFKYSSAVFLLVIISSCAHKDFATKYSFSEKTFSAKKYYYTLTTNSEIKATTNNKNVVTNNTATLGFTYQLEADSLGNRIVKITYDKFHITVKKDDEDADVYDSEKEGDSSPLMDRVLAKIKGSSIIITANKNGKILNTVGAKEILDKITSILPNYEDGSNEDVKKQLEDFIGDKFIKDNIAQNLSLIPDSALSIGSTWTQKTNLNGNIPFDATITYTLENVENGVGAIHSSADFTNSAGKPISIIGIMANADLKGNITGDYKALEKSGFLISAESTLKITGTIYVSNQEIPVSISIKKSIKAVEVGK